jgi:UDP-2,3-diacylglucosamine hydrolase
LRALSSAPLTPSYLDAPPHWRRIEFISDLHLSAESTRTLEALRQYLFDTRADALFLLGDLFEAWVGDDARHAPFEQRCVQLLHQASLLRPLHFMAGNRDFLLGPAMAADAGLHRLDDPTVLVAQGRRWLLSHGDAWCVADTEYQRFRSEVRSPLWQQAFLGQALEQRREQARRMREVSRQRQQAAGSNVEGWADVDTALALQWLQAAGAPALIHGHTHKPADVELAPGLWRHVLSDWDADHAAPARAQVLRLQDGRLSRHPLGASGS